MTLSYWPSATVAPTVKTVAALELVRFWRLINNHLILTKVNYVHQVLWCFAIWLHVKFIYSEKATKFCNIFTLFLSYVVPVKIKVKILQIFVAFSEYMNFITQASFNMHLRLIYFESAKRFEKKTPTSNLNGWFFQILWYSQKTSTSKLTGHKCSPHLLVELLLILKSVMFMSDNWFPPKQIIKHKQDLYWYQ